MTTLTKTQHDDGTESVGTGPDARQSHRPYREMGEADLVALRGEFAVMAPGLPLAVHCLELVDALLERVRGC